MGAKKLSNYVALPETKPSLDELLEMKKNWDDIYEPRKKAWREKMSVRAKTLDDMYKRFEAAEKEEPIKPDLPKSPLQDEEELDFGEEFKLFKNAFKEEVKRDPDFVNKVTLGTGDLLWVPVFFGPKRV